MDSKSMEASFIVDRMVEQHFNGGYFSDEVKARHEEVRKLDPEQKARLFADCFNRAFDIATELTTSPKFDDGELDLSDEGLGIIVIEISQMSKEDLEESGYENPLGYRMLTVFPKSFKPTSEAYTKYDEEDWLGSGNPRLAYRQQHPAIWNDYSMGIALNDEGEVADYFADIDTYILLALDQIETLEIAKSRLNNQLT